ncbi:MAG: DedA family protein [Deltaproteobacteria bacterium]|nr:DedA family protein [Deltaproteobacteria bacterium]
MDLSVIQDAIANYGYWALFAGTFFEGETFFILAGIAARKGLLNPYYVALVAMLGGFIGDQFFFALGRWRGAEVFTWSSSIARKAVEARRLFRRHAVLLILLSRFLIGLRMIIPLACGMAGIPVWRFVLLNFTSALAWCLVFGGLGYLFGGIIFDRLDLIKGLQMVVVLVLAVLAVSYVVMKLIKRRLMRDGDSG